MRILGILLIAVCLCACLPRHDYKGPASVEYIQYELDEDPLLVNQDDTRLATINFKESHDLAGLKLSNFARSEIRQLLATKGVMLANNDRDHSQRLEEEILVFEAGGFPHAMLRQNANIILRGEISSATLSHEFFPATNLEIDDHLRISSARCVSTASVSGFITLYTVNPIGKLSTDQFSGQASVAIEGTSCRNLTQQNQQSLFRNAFSAAAERSRDKLMRVLARPGHVISAYRSPDKNKPHLFKISLHPIDGAIPGKQVTFYRYSRDTSGQTELLPIGEAEIACTLNTRSTFARVKDPSLIMAIKKYTPVKLNHTGGASVLDEAQSTIPCSP